MLTKQDVQKVRSQMTNELNASLRTVIACAVLLLLLVCVAWQGAEATGAEATGAAIAVETL